MLSCCVVVLVRIVAQYHVVLEYLSLAGMLRCSSFVYCFLPLPIQSLTAFEVVRPVYG